jgi:PQQ system protein
MPACLPGRPATSRLPDSPLLGKRHCALLPSNGDSQFIWLVNHSRGTASLNLDGPGYYWYGSPTGNDEGRGLIGAIVVMGEAPPEARLDRPPQPRP